MLVEYVIFLPASSGGGSSLAVCISLSVISSGSLSSLVKTLYQLKSAKYEPFVKYQLGMLSEIKVRLRFKKLKKTIVYNIVAQNLSKQSLHCEVIVKSDDKYNKMTEAMLYFNIFFLKKAISQDIARLM